MGVVALLTCISMLVSGIPALAQVGRVPDRQILTLLERGETEAAEAILVEAIEEEPDSPQLLAWLGAARYMNRKYLTAEEPLRRAVELGQKDLGTQYYLASTLWENGQLDEAAVFCRQAIETYGSKLPLVHLLGRLYLWQGRYEEAGDWLEKAVEMSPSSLDLWLDLAGALAGAGRNEDALMAYRRAVDLAPDHYQVRYGLARLLAKTGESDAAAKELVIYRELLEQDQERTQQEGLLQSQIDLGYEYLRQGEVGAAITHLQGLPVSVDVLAALARAYEQTGDREAALGALERAVALSPERQDLRARLAEGRLAEGVD